MSDESSLQSIRIKAWLSTSQHYLISADEDNGVIKSLQIFNETLHQKLQSNEIFPNKFYFDYFNKDGPKQVRERY